MIVAVNNFGDTRSGGLAGPMGLFIIVLMSIAVVLLIRNMNKRVRRLPDSFPDPRDARRDAEIAKPVYLARPPMARRPRSAAWRLARAAPRSTRAGTGTDHARTHSTVQVQASRQW